MIDLHMHSTASDGTDTPEAIITKCAKLRLELCAITDHDTIDSQQQAVETAKKLGQKYITGVEFSVRHEGELHILGYGVDVYDAAFRAQIGELMESRVGRVHAILGELKKHDIRVGFDDVLRHAEGNTLGRPHVALALMEKGYADSMQDAFSKYLNENGLCYVQRRKLNAAQAMELIKSAGGTPVLAHPKFIRTDDMEGLVADMVRAGLEGIEAYYPAHTDSDVKKFLKIYNMR